VSTLLVALDVPTRAEAVRLAEILQPHVGGFKVGLELLMGEGPAIVGDVASFGNPIFVDAKLHDIPNTVEKAAGRLGELGARWVTVHASGGGEMMEVAAYALRSGSNGAGVLGVTVLTSLDQASLGTIGVERDLSLQVQELARLSAVSGAEGVVCAVSEASGVKGLDLGLLVATPGIRPASVEAGDQKRVATVREAIEAGADLLVVGRPITAADDPADAARAIRREMETAVQTAPPSAAG
jgi:orotidine-5'-phosphate decarboxylase